MGMGSVVAGSLLTILLVSNGIYGWRMQAILSGSMSPLLPIGSVVLTKTLSPSAYVVGDVVTFKLPTQPRELVTHRILTRTYSPSGVLMFVTKGDANTRSDGWNISSGAVLGKVIMTIPRLGYLVYALHIPVGFMAMALLTLCACVLPIWRELLHKP
jgi:signal peptidase